MHRLMNVSLSSPEAGVGIGNLSSSNYSPLVREILLRTFLSNELAEFLPSVSKEHAEPKQSITWNSLQHFVSVSLKSSFPFPLIHAVAAKLLDSSRDRNDLVLFNPAFDEALSPKTIHPDPPSNTCLPPLVYVPVRQNELELWMLLQQLFPMNPGQVPNKLEPLVDLQINAATKDLPCSVSYFGLTQVLCAVNDRESQLSHCL